MQQREIPDGFPRRQSGENLCISFLWPGRCPRGNARLVPVVRVHVPLYGDGKGIEWEISEYELFGIINGLEAKAKAQQKYLEQREGVTRPLA